MTTVPQLAKGVQIISELLHIIRDGNLAIGEEPLKLQLAPPSKCTSLPKSVWSYCLFMSRSIRLASSVV